MPFRASTEASEWIDMSSLLQYLAERDIRAVIFDLDDTLYPEIQYVKSGFRAVSEKIKEDFGIDCYELLFKTFHADSKGVYNRALDELGIAYDKEYVAKLVGTYRNHVPQGLEFYADVLPFLSELKRLNIRVGIITDGRVEGQKSKLSALKCWELFDSVIITDELGGESYRKPSKKAFEMMCAEFCVRFTQTAYIGDNPTKDFYIGADGVFTVRIKRGDALNLGGGEYYKGVKEQLLVESFT